MLKIYFMFYKHGYLSLFRPFLVVKRCWIMTASIATCRWGVLTRLLGPGSYWIGYRWLMLSGPNMHHPKTSYLLTTRHRTLPTLELGYTCGYIYQRRFWDSLGTYNGFPWTHLSILKNMSLIVRHGPSEISMQWQWSRLFHMGLHGLALDTTCLGIKSIHIHTCFHHRRESHHTVQIHISPQPRPRASGVQMLDYVSGVVYSYQVMQTIFSSFFFIFNKK